MKPTQIFFSIFLSLSLSSPTLADVTIKSVTKSDGFAGFGAHKRTSTRSIQGLKSRTTEGLKFKSFVMKVANKKEGKEVDIVRVDQGKHYKLKVKKKKYSEYPIKFEKPELPDFKKMGQQPGAKGGPSNQKPTHRLKGTSFKVNKTGKTKKANGFSLTEHKVTMIAKMEEIASKEVTEYQMINNIWVTPWTAKLRKAVEEEKRFTLAYLKKMGVGVDPKSMKMFDTSSMAAMLGVSGKKAERMAKSVARKLATIKGYPIITESQWIIKEDPKAKARRAAAMKKAKETEVEDDVNYNGGAKGIASSFLGNFAKKKMKDKMAKKQKDRMSGPVLSTYHEIKSIDFSKIPKSQFEIPTGFKKEKKKNRS